MPFILLHYPIAYITHKISNKLSLPALITSSFIPDLEHILFTLMAKEPRRGLILHSLFGAASLGLLLSILLTTHLYPVVISFLFKLDKGMVQENCRFSIWLILSCLIGVISHVIIDSLHHEFNPLLFPFLKESFNALILFGDWILANQVVHLVFTALTALILIYELRKGTSGFWKRLLIC